MTHAGKSSGYRWEERDPLCILCSVRQCADSGYHTPLIATEATKCSDVVAIIESARETDTHAALMCCLDALPRSL